MMETDMRTYFLTLPIGAGALARGLAALATALTKQLKALVRARRNRKEAAALAGLDRRMLKDIGITRADLNDAFSSPFWEDPTSLLRERAVERRVNRGLRTASISHIRGPEKNFVAPRLDRPSRQAV
jgi:uncharacterized protein YjiS (DUF1127 family)